MRTSHLLAGIAGMLAIATATPAHADDFLGNRIEHLCDTRCLTNALLVKDFFSRIDGGAERCRPPAQRMHDVAQGPQGVHRSGPPARSRDATDGAAAEVRARIRPQVFGIV